MPAPGSSDTDAAGIAVAAEQWEERIQDLRLARLVALPARGSPLAHDAVDFERDPRELLLVFGARLPYGKKSHAASLW
jgi:hypothetical protein